jgi:hypothetical protein
MSLPSVNTGTTNTNTNTNSVANTSSSNFQTTSPPQWYLDAWQSVLGRGQDILNTSPYTVAGMMPDQETASMLTNQLVQNYMQRPQIPAYDVFGMGNQWDTGPISIGGDRERAVASLATPAMMRPEQLAPDEPTPFMNPYIAQVINPTLVNLRNQELEQQANIAGRGAAQGMLGGSQAAIASAQADRDYRNQLAQSAGGLLKGGYDTAAQLASQNVDRRQNAASLNAQMQQAANVLNAQLGTDVSKYNAGLGLQYGQLGADLAKQYQNLRFSGAQNDANRFLTALQQQQGMDTQSMQTLMGMLGQLNTMGGQQQATAQRALDDPFRQLQLLAAMLAGNPGQILQSNTTGTNVTNTTGTGTSQTDRPLDLASILLGSLGVAGRLGFSSDREDKTDIKRLGEQNGMPIYAYRYKGDPKSYPKVVGPMAQDLEKLMPGVTQLIGGHRIINA